MDIREKIMKDTEEEIKKIIDEANRFQKEGKYQEALAQLDFAWIKTGILPDRNRREPLYGLICHYSGRIWQAKGNFEAAVHELRIAAGYRQDIPVDYAHTMYRIFLCKIYGKMPISEMEVEQTKLALSTAMKDDATTVADGRDMRRHFAEAEALRKRFLQNDFERRAK